MRASLIGVRERYFIFMSFYVGRSFLVHLVFSSNHFLPSRLPALAKLIEGGLRLTDFLVKISDDKMTSGDSTMTKVSLSCVLLIWEQFNQHAYAKLLSTQMLWRSTSNSPTKL